MAFQPQLTDSTNSQPSYRSQIVQSLGNFRREWEKIVNGKSLTEVEAPIGLLLSDIADRMKLNSQERKVMLGGKLTKEVHLVKESRATKLIS